MKKQPHLRILAAALTLAFCILGSSSALAAPAATPTTRPEKEVVEPNDTTQTSLDYLEFLLYTGGPFRFQEAAIKHPADDADAGPAEGAVATLTIYSQTTNNTEPIDISGHSFVAVRNVSDHAIEVGGQEIAPGTGVTIGTRANRPEHEGIWYNLEGYYCHYISAFYPNLYSMQVSLDEDGLAVLNQNLTTADHWSTAFNCASFAAGLWNSVCSDHLSAGTPHSPKGLKASIRSYGSKLRYNESVPYDYIVSYGTARTPSADYS